MDTTVSKTQCVYCVIIGPPFSYYGGGSASDKELTKIIMDDVTVDRYIEGIYSSYQYAILRAELAAKRLSCGEGGKWEKAHDHHDNYRRNCDYREVFIEAIEYNSVWLDDEIKVIKDHGMVEELKSGKSVYLLIEDHNRYYTENGEAYRLIKPAGCGSKILGIYTQLSRAKKMALEKRQNKEFDKNLWKKVEGRDEWIYDMKYEIYIIERIVDMN